MIDRQTLGDVGLAVLLALPTAALARPTASMIQAHTVAAAAPQVQAAVAEQARPQTSQFGFRG